VYFPDRTLQGQEAVDAIEILCMANEIRVTVAVHPCQLAGMELPAAECCARTGRIAPVA
jgi:hypothetical protein